MPAIATLAGSCGYGRSQTQQAAPPSGIGLTSNNPGSNAAAVYADGSTSNGFYWIRTSVMSSAYQVYCNMEDGAWMLISYNGHKQDPILARRGQLYPVGWSNELGSNTLGGMMAANFNDLWYSGASNQCTQLMRLAFTGSNAVPVLSNAYIGHTVTYGSNVNLIAPTTASGLQGTAVFNPSAVRVGATWNALKGYTTLSNYSTSAASDLLYNQGTNFYWNPCLPIADQSLRSGSGLDIGGWMRTQDRDSWGLANVNVNSSSGGNSFPGNTLAVFIR